jgi:hypothetical protein
MLGIPGRAGKQPRRVRSPQQHGSKFGDVFVDERGHVLIEVEVQGKAILDIVALENEPVRRAGAARPYQVFADLDVIEIAEPHRGEGEDRDGRSKLRRQCSLNRRMIL